MTRDISAQALAAKLKAYGFVSTGVLGYWQLPNSSCSVSTLNAGPSRRNILAYMLAELEKQNARAAIAARTEPNEPQT